MSCPECERYKKQVDSLKTENNKLSRLRVEEQDSVIRNISVLKNQMSVVYQRYQEQLTKHNIVVDKYNKLNNVLNNHKKVVARLNNEMREQQFAYSKEKMALIRKNSELDEKYQNELLKNTFLIKENERLNKVDNYLSEGLKRIKQMVVSNFAKIDDYAFKTKQDINILEQQIYNIASAINPAIELIANAKARDLDLYQKVVLLVNFSLNQKKINDEMNRQLTNEMATSNKILPTEKKVENIIQSKQKFANISANLLYKQSNILNNNMQLNNKTKYQYQPSNVIKYYGLEQQKVKKNNYINNNQVGYYYNNNKQLNK